MVLVVVSLMTGFGIKALQGNSNGNCYDKTRLQMRDISAAMEAFARNNNRYPRPAASNIGVTNIKFGKEDPSSDGPAYAAIDKVGTTAYIGALPYATLGLPSIYAADCWGNKFYYIVTQSLTVDLTTAGAINIKTGPLASSSNVTTQAAYAVVSGGQDALGMSQRNYAGTKKNCNTQQANAAITRVDKENCDTNNAIIYSTVFNNGPNAHDYFDDLVIYKEKSSTLISDCVPSDISWLTNCSAPVGALASGGSTTVSNSVTGYTGSATVTCTNGALGITGSPTCSATSCPTQSKSWTANGNTCTGMTPELVDNQSGTVTNTTAGYTGQATATCHTGVLDNPLTNGTCYANCPAQSNSWLTNCSAPFPNTASGGTSNQNNTAGGYVGNATFLCTNGVWSVTGSPTCQSTTCSAQSLSWQTNCSASFPTTGPGLNSTQSNTAPNYMGSATFQCVLGTWTLQSGSTCASTSCPAQSVNWLSNCSGATASTLTSGSSTSVANTAPGFTGSTTATCTNAVISTSGSTCNANCPAASGVTWLTNCSGNVPGLTSGNSTTVSNTAANYTGSETATCTNGVINYTGQSCTGNPCPASTATWGGGNCSATYGQITSGSTATPTNTHAGYTGSVTLTCTAGSVGQSGATCYANCGAASPTWLTNCAGTVTAGLAGSGATQTVTNTNSGYVGSETATCTNGTLGYSGASCAVATCSTPCGTINSGQTCTVWNASSSCGGCSSAVISCNNGSTSGGNGWTATSCNNSVCASCSSPCGTIASGATCTAWNTSGSCGGCASQPRTCTNGSLSGTYGYASCNNSSCASCSSPCGTIAHGATCTAYANNLPVGTNCVSQVETCNNGTLSPNNYAYGSCANGCAATSDSWNGPSNFCTASIPSGYSGQSYTQTNTSPGYTGTQTATCSNGTWSTAGGTCTAVVNGVCGGSANTCNAGSPSGYSAGSCGGSQTWSCVGSGGGSTASCSIANGPCCSSPSCQPIVVDGGCLGPQYGCYNCTPNGNTCTVNGSDCITQYCTAIYQCQSGNWAIISNSCSDRRLKEDIVQVASDARGFGIYEFSYKFDPAHHRYRGVMAQEVMGIPGAVDTMPNGYYTVNYRAVGVPFVRLR